MNEPTTYAFGHCIWANTGVAAAVENLYIPDIRTAIDHSLVPAIRGTNVSCFRV